ncbi:MAG: Asp-tRNA(Asn)/Glu-tRNA(Gln) amidotransferase subunit GatB, partial [Candidatus Nealsonbacteria bacterium]
MLKLSNQMMNYQPTIGLEIHVELRTKSKMFCSCLNNPDEKHPNINICPICLGHPGTLPVINEEAVKKVIKTGLALNSRIPEHSKFDRKNYFYPDLPKGYQISQYDAPICQGGWLEVRPPDITILGGRTSPNRKKINITRVHLEEDTGRLIHPKGTEYSLVDFNRAGVPLMELVTEPDITSAKEAKAFAEELRLILRYLRVSHADMEKGEMRVEVNISLKNGKELGTKVEIKNLNSFRSVEYGIDYEIARQGKLLDAGKKVVQETRGWDAAKEVTVSQRIKESAHDYRYFPEPDLPPLQFEAEDIKKIKGEIPELPQLRRERFKEEYGLGFEETEMFVQNKELGEYFEKVVSESSDKK